MLAPPTPVAAGPATVTSDAPSPTSTSLIPPYGSEQWDSFIGIITAIVGNVLISFALNTQRYAHIRLEREWQEKERQRKRRSALFRSLSGSKPYRDHEPRADEDTASEEDPLLPATPSRRSTGDSPVHEEGGTVNEPAYKQKSYLKSPYWWAGIIMMTCGEAGNFLAYGFAPASIVSPLGVVALISNCMIAPFMLKEPFRTRDALGVLVAVGGAVTVVLSASDNNPKLGPDDIWSLISTWEFETYCGITVAVIIALAIASNRYGDKNILIDLGLVGLFGGYTALSTKGVASMLSYTLWHAITFPVTYLLVAILVGTAVMQIKYINRALQRFNATQVIPVQFVLFTLSVILGSAILYRDFERTSRDDAAKFIGGCAMTFLGVWLITSGRPPRSEEDEDRDPEPEDAINLMDGERYHDNIDGNNDSGSGRSSTIRAASPPINIGQGPPSCEISQPAAPDITLTPDTASEDPATPKNAPSVPSSLIINPWDEEGTDAPALRSRPSGPSRNSTYSAPVQPLEVPDAPRHSTSSPELISAPRPQTPVRQISDTAAMTPTPPSTLQQRLRRIVTSERVGSNNTLSGQLLASPLSTSLSAIVADLKRNGSLKGPPLQRESSGGGRRRQSILGIGTDEMDAQFGEPLDRRRTTTDESNTSESMGAREQPSGRGRGLSGTLNELWRGWRGGQQDGDVERGEGDTTTPQQPALEEG